MFSLWKRYQLISLLQPTPRSLLQPTPTPPSWWTMMYLQHCKGSKLSLLSHDHIQLTHYYVHRNIDLFDSTTPVGSSTFFAETPIFTFITPKSAFLFVTFFFSTCSPTNVFCEWAHETWYHYITAVLALPTGVWTLNNTFCYNQTRSPLLHCWIGFLTKYHLILLCLLLVLLPFFSVHCWWSLVTPLPLTTIKGETSHQSKKKRHPLVVSRFGHLSSRLTQIILLHHSGSYMHWQ